MVSYLDRGTAAMLESAGLELVSAAGLIQRFKGLLDERGIASLERAAVVLYDAVDQTWETARRAFRDKTPLTEGDLLRVMTAAIESRGLVTDHPPIVAAGANAGNPHYAVVGAGAPVREGDVVQFDLWAKEADPLAIYADISWIGVFAPAPAPEYEKAFQELIAVREGVYGYIAGELAAGRTISGAMADAHARDALIRLGYGPALKHRTGHGIDTQCHGSGVNIDCWEFPDHRPILEGSCFSLEPGIYFSGFGMRTEIDVYIRDGRAVISQGDRRQFELLRCGPSAAP
jgi:Xaa-Pro aminopeptidase